MLIFFQLDWIDLLTRFLGLRRLRLVTVLVFARLVLRLANEYYTIDVNIYFEKKKWSVFVKLCSDDCKCNQANQTDYT